MCEQVGCNDQAFLKLEIKFRVELKKENILFHLCNFNLIQFNMG